MKMEHKDNTRTLPQNNSLHNYCTEMAQELNNAGITMAVFMQNIEAEHTMESVKSLWRAFAKAKYGKTSTKDLTTQQIDVIFDEVNRHVGQWGLHLDFPHYPDDEEIKRQIHER
jgi:hypothetical protein